MKKYRLEIPEMLRKIDSLIAVKLMEDNILELESKVYNNEGIFYHRFYVPWDWLTEIKEPVSAEEYINKNFPNTIEKFDYKRHSFFTMDDAVTIFKAGEENERLKHKPIFNVLLEWREKVRTGEEINEVTKRLINKIDRSDLIDHLDYY